MRVTSRSRLRVAHAYESLHIYERRARRVFDFDFFDFELRLAIDLRIRVN